MDEFLNKRKLLDWVNQQCKFNAVPILQTRFQFLIIDVFQETIGHIKKYVDFYRDQNIDYVLTFELNSVKDFAAIETQQDVINFNETYGVELVLPTEQV